MDVLAEKLDAKLREWKPNTVAEKSGNELRKLSISQTMMSWISCNRVS